MIARPFLIAFLLLSACGYAGEQGEDYKGSLAAKPIYSTLQHEYGRLDGRPPQPYAAAEMEGTRTVAFAVDRIVTGRDKPKYIVFTAFPRRGQVLSVPDADPSRIHVDRHNIIEAERRSLMNAETARVAMTLAR